ncbi:hypothetical protein RRT02_000592 [Salmonella enterica]|nr:hypothetical protein [Salmonella enterica]
MNSASNAEFTADVIARLLQKITLVPPAAIHATCDSVPRETIMEEKQTTTATGDQSAPVSPRTEPETAKPEPVATQPAPASQPAPARVYVAESFPGDNFEDVNVALEYLRRNVTRPLKNQFSEELEFSWSDFPALIDHIKPSVVAARLMWFQNWGWDENDVRCVKTQWIHVPSKTEIYTIYYPEGARLPSGQPGRQNMLQAAAEETFHFRRAMYAALGIRPGDDEEDVKLQKKRHYKQKALADAANECRPWKRNAPERTKEQSLLNVRVASGSVTDPALIAQAKSLNPDLTTPADERTIASVQAIPELTERALFWLRQLCSMSDEFRYYLDDPRATTESLPRQLWLRACEQAAVEYVGGEPDPTIPADPASVAMPVIKTYPAPAGMEHSKRVWDEHTLSCHADDMRRQLEKCRLLMSKKIPNAEMLDTLNKTKSMCDTATCAEIDKYIEQVNARPDYVPRKRRTTTDAPETPTSTPDDPLARQERYWEEMRRKGRMAALLDELMVLASSHVPAPFILAKLQEARARKDIDLLTRNGIDKLIANVSDKSDIAREYWQNRKMSQDNEYHVANKVQYVTHARGADLVNPPDFDDDCDDNDDDIAVILGAEDDTACPPGLIEKHEKRQAKTERTRKQNKTPTTATSSPAAENPVITLCKNALATYQEGDDPESVIEFLLACRSHTDPTTGAEIGVMIDDFSLITSLSRPLDVDENDLPY